MDLNSIVTILGTKRNGVAFGITYNTDLEKSISAKAKRDGHKVTKTVRAVVRKGIDYSEQKAVKDMVDDGYVLTHKLPWGSWNDKFENVIDYKDSHYIRLYAFGNNPFNTKYFLDGVECSKEDLRGIMNNGFFKETEKPLALTIKADNIMEIR